MPTGPYYRTTDELWPNGARKTSIQQTWYRTGAFANHRAPLPYIKKYAKAFTEGSDAPNLTAGYHAFSDPPHQWSNWRDDVHNRCYAKFVAKTQSAAAQIGASLGERKQSIDMIEKRLRQIGRAAKSLKRGRFYEFLRELGILPSRWVPRRSDPKRAADLWLEYWFGWSPLLSDIYQACIVLQSPVPQLIKARAREVCGAIPVLDLSSWGSVFCTEHKLYGVLREQMGARVTVSNPNLWRANELGLVNPVSIAWELVPFSFVVDWFIPIGQFIDSWTDFFGLTVEEPYTTETRYYESSYRAFYTSTGDTFLQDNGRGFRFERYTAINGPAVRLRPWRGLSMTRAATAMSITIQQLHNLASTPRWSYR